MYKNTGSRIKDIAELLAGLGIALCVILGIVLFLIGMSVHNDEIGLPLVIVGFVIAVLGSIFVWWSHIILAGYGELIEETTKSAAELKEIKELLARKQVNQNEGEAAKKEISTK